MVSILRSSIILNLVIALLLIPAVGMAADFELFWDPNCNSDPTLEGYNIYYKEDASVVGDQNGVIDFYVDLTDIDFDADNPSYLIPGLLDGVRYCFAVTAWYGDEESGMSNEICGIDGVYTPSPSPSSNGGSSDGSTNNLSGGCFIGALK